MGRGRQVRGRQRAYGYLVKRKLTEAGEILRSDREIHPEEAATVHRIFRDYAAGQSPNRIADLLNREGIPDPRRKAWDKSTIHGNPKRDTGILNNEIYLGKLA